MAASSSDTGLDRQAKRGGSQGIGTDGGSDEALGSCIDTCRLFGPVRNQDYQICLGVPL